MVPYRVDPVNGLSGSPIQQMRPSIRGRSRELGRYAGSMLNFTVGSKGYSGALPGNAPRGRSSSSRWTCAAMGEGSRDVGSTSPLYGSELQPEAMFVH